MAEDISFVRLLPEDEDELALNEQSMDGSGPASSSFILPRTPVGDSTPPSLTALIDEGRRSSASPCPRDPKGQYPTTADLADFLRHTEPQIREHGSNSSLLSLYKRNESLRPRDLWPSKFSTRLLQSVQANLPSSPLREKGNFPSTKAVQKFSTTGMLSLQTFLWCFVDIPFQAEHI